MLAPLISLNLSHDIPSSSHLTHLGMYPVQQHPSCTLYHNNSSGISDLYDVADGIGSMTIDDTDEHEANLVMDLARARQDMFRVEKMLADCVVWEHKIMVDLSKHQSNVSKKKLDKVDIGLGFITIWLSHIVCSESLRLKCAGGMEHTMEQDAALNLLNFDGMDDD
ncbi:hypothetical protein EDB19DRAFT_1829484 [Suillus lakei]|nr:hypothetical protein EDB19DRAFT_1829484 [Suillus lakei]